jgi:hypothetical protein
VTPVSDQQETSANTTTEFHSQGEANPHRQEHEGSDVGGPAATGDFGVESSLDKTSTLAEDDSPDSQSDNPL